jgi:hypothetical protein
MYATVLLLLSSMASAASNELAVEYRGSGISRSLSAYLTDVGVRGAHAALSGSTISVLPSEVRLARAKELGAPSKCWEDDCKLTVASSMELGYLVTGLVKKRGNKEEFWYSMEVKLYKVDSGSLLASNSVSAPDLTRLRDAVKAETGRLVESLATP